MSEKENIHSGHRKRMFEKFIENKDGILDHEMLEILLFAMVPRIDTNPIAHRLINTFGSIKDVFSVSVEELSQVQGVGKKTAQQIYFLGEIFNRIEKSKKHGIKLSCFEKVKQEIEDLFNDETKEKFYLFLLDKNYKKLATIDFSDKEETSVNLEVSVLAKYFALYKPKHAIIAHNHPSGLAEPSANDDLSTKKINLLCMAHGVNFADHVIYGKGNVYSYKQSGKLDEIKKKADLNVLLNNL
jgi:DNA repair protein RadC